MNLAFQLECGRTGSPAHVFNKPSISRTTANPSRVFRHQWSASKGSSGAAQMIAFGFSPTTFFHSVLTRRVCAGEVTIITLRLSFRRISRAVSPTFCSVSMILTGRI